MPIYEYVCSACQTGFELLVRGETEVHCPHCQSSQLEKQWSVPAAHNGMTTDLPVCQPPAGGGCGLPACQSSCQFES